MPLPSKFAVPEEFSYSISLSLTCTPRSEIAGVGAVPLSGSERVLPSKPTQNYHLFVKSFAGFGGNAIHARYFKYLLDNTQDDDPCMLRNQIDTISRDGRHMEIRGSGSFVECYLKVVDMLTGASPKNTTVDAVPSATPSPPTQPTQEQPASSAAMPKSNSPSLPSAPDGSMASGMESGRTLLSQSSENYDSDSRESMSPAVAKPFISGK